MNKAQKEVLQAQLDREKELIKDLKQVFGQAQDDVVNKIIDLSRRQDMENLQTIIYQMQYQEVLKQQIDTVLDQLQANEYTRIEQYRADCYTDGYAGGMYNIAKSSGIPCIAPIDVKSVEKAVKIDSKLSKTLYKSLDMSELKKSVRMNVSRGILSGLTWVEIGREIGRTMKGTPFQKAMNNGIRIARTEGHRIQTTAHLDAAQAAKERGADVVKQWDAILDSRTRETHIELDGQIRELDEDFEYSGGTVKAPGHFGIAKEDINCRCAVLTRARWAVEGGFTKRDNFTGELRQFNSPKDYEEFKKWYFSKENINYMNYTEKLEKRYNTKNFETLLTKIDDSEYNHLKMLESASPMWKEHESITKSASYAVESKVINSRSFIEKFDKMTDDVKVRREYLSNARAILKHRSGQNGEDLYLYNSRMGSWAKSTSGNKAGTPEYTEEIKRTIQKSKRGDLVAFHNHPASMPPSVSDINAAFHNGYAKGFVLCHDGKIYEYTYPDREVSVTTYNMRVAYYKKKKYNEFEAQLNTMEYLAKIYGFKFKEVK